MQTENEQQPSFKGCKQLKQQVKEIDFNQIFLKKPLYSKSLAILVTNFQRLI
jgi:ABC-type Zn uptake system ZnuABC Zn-binding protein ZnuA